MSMRTVELHLAHQSRGLAMYSVVRDTRQSCTLHNNLLSVRRSTVDAAAPRSTVDAAVAIPVTMPIAVSPTANKRTLVVKVVSS